jgi:hypothetical protein
MLRGDADPAVVRPVYQRANDDMQTVWRIAVPLDHSRPASEDHMTTPEGARAEALEIVTAWRKVLRAPRAWQLEPAQAQDLIDLIAAALARAAQGAQAVIDAAIKWQDTSRLDHRLVYQHEQALFQALNDYRYSATPEPPTEKEIMSPSRETEFKVWFAHKTLDAKILVRAVLQPTDDMNKAMTAVQVMLAQVTKNPDDWQVWE